MTIKQWRRTKVFALRMVRVSTSPRWRGALYHLVARALDSFENNGSHLLFEDWDNSYFPDGRYINDFGDSAELLCDEVNRFTWDMEDEGVLPRYPEESDRESVLAIKLTCCIRAAVDVACAPSAGVLGWTAGDIRRMWPRRQVPAWVKVVYSNFDELSDENYVWL